MIVIGIDMSKNSPGVCIREDDKLTFLSFIRGSEEGGRMSKSRKRMIDHYALLRAAGVKITANHRSTQIKEYSKLEAYKIMDATLLANTIVASLPDQVDMVGMEGFSYGSKGNAGLDIAGYAYCLRKSLYEKYGNKLCIFSPGNVKKQAGKGNAGKEEIMEFFLKCNDVDLRENALWKGLEDKSISADKPVDDLIDSYYVQECTRLYYAANKLDTI
jgi:hypothetical protein